MTKDDNNMFPFSDFVERCIGKYALKLKYKMSLVGPMISMRISLSEKQKDKCKGYDLYDLVGQGKEAMIKSDKEHDLRMIHIEKTSASLDGDILELSGSPDVIEYVIDAIFKE